MINRAHQRMNLLTIPLIWNNYEREKYAKVDPWAADRAFSAKLRPERNGKHRLLEAVYAGIWKNNPYLL